MIFRKFNNSKPELVGIIKDGNQNTFKDISRDLYHAASEPNEELAIDEIKVFIQNRLSGESRVDGRRVLPSTYM